MRASPEQVIHSLLLNAYLLLWIGVIFLAVVVCMIGLVLKLLNKGASFRNMLIYAIPAACSVGLLVAVCIPLGTYFIGDRAGLTGLFNEWLAIELLLFSLIGFVLGIAYGIALSLPKFKVLRLPTSVFAGFCALISTVMLILLFLGNI